MKYIIAGHGQYPQGTLDTVTLLVGNRDDIFIVSASPENNDYQQKLTDYMVKYENEGLVIFTDLVIGSVNQYCAQCLKTHSFELISGYNLALILEIILQSDLSSQQIDEIVERSKQQLIYINEVLGR